MKSLFSSLILSYLRLFAQAQIFKLKLINPQLKIIGVTGSAGKTSTIAAIEAALRNFKVKTTAGSNSESGIPLSLLNIKVTGYSSLNWLKYLILAPIHLLIYSPKLDFLVIEMGIDGQKAPKNMEYLLTIVRPDVGIFLNVTPVHLMNFDSLEAIAIEKAKLPNTTNIAIVDPSLQRYLTNHHLYLIKPTDINYPQLLPHIYHHSFGATLALIDSLKLDRQLATNNINHYFQLPPGRSSIFKGLNHSTIIDSSYNSSPLATAEMLEFLKSFPSPRVAILGDMRELGSATRDEHLKLYRLALKSADQIISVGPETSKYFGPKAVQFTYWWQALEYIKQHLPQHSTILVKGSQNTIYLEELINGLLVNKSDSKKLCRQSPYWLKIKKDFKKSTL